MPSIHPADLPYHLSALKGNSRAFSYFLTLSETDLNAQLRYSSISVFLKDFCADLQLQLAAVNEAASHFTLYYNENSISGLPFFNLKLKGPFPPSARIRNLRM